MSGTVRGPVLFLAELYQRSDFPPEGAIAADDIDRSYNVYKLDLGVPSGYESSYWAADFGGNYDDLPNAGLVQIVLGRYLQKVESEADMLDVEDSYYADGKVIYMHLPRKPWQYKATETNLLKVRGYSSGPKSPSNPSATRYGAFNYPARLDIPSVAAKLSNPLSGINLLLQWSISLRNEDGHFDDPSENQFFNTPVILYKTTENSPTLDDFTAIRYGLAISQETDFERFKLKMHDIARELEEEVCDKFSTSEFPDCPDNVTGKDKPRIWGSVLGVELYEIDSTDDTKFYAGDDVTAVSAVYDSDGASLAFTFEASTGIITEATGDAVTADVTGSTDNMIGEMIVGILEERSDIYFNDSAWDTEEAEAYRSDSPTVNFYWKSGTVKKFITDLLKNDNAFLIQKNDGKLTLRKWQTDSFYAQHVIPEWTITGRPSRDFRDAQENFLSAVQINYQKNIKAGTFGKSYYDDSQQDTIFEAYNKKRLGIFEVQLSEDADVATLGDATIDRFGTMKETIKIAVGYDTANINLLDWVYLDVIVNGRTFSEKNGWFVKEVNTAQDTVTLEEEGVYERYDLILGDADASINILGDADAAEDLLGPPRFLKVS